MIHARLTKLSTLPGGQVAPDGGRDGKPIHEGYTVKGHYVNPPKVGEGFRVLRYESNGVAIPGIMDTSPVTRVSAIAAGYRFETMNSVYELVHLL